MKNLAEYNQIFFNFVQDYDLNNPNIIRKIIHSYAVAERCFAIATQMTLSLTQQHFAYLCGLFHDLGRFEQWRRFQTYDDLASINHGQLSAEIILAMTNLDLTIDEQQYLAKICAAHASKQTALNDDVFVKIVKNADSLANILTVANGCMPVTTTKSGYTAGILNNFTQLLPIYNINGQTTLDRCLQMTANAYYVTLPFLRQEILDKKFLSAIETRFAGILAPEDLQTYQQAVSIMLSNYH